MPTKTNLERLVQRLIFLATPFFLPNSAFACAESVINHGISKAPNGLRTALAALIDTIPMSSLPFLSFLTTFLSFLPPFLLLKRTILALPAKAAFASLIKPLMAFAIADFFGALYAIETSVSVAETGAASAKQIAAAPNNFVAFMVTLPLIVASRIGSIVSEIPLNSTLI